MVNWLKPAGAVVDDFDPSDILIDKTYRDTYIALCVRADALTVIGMIGVDGRGLFTWSVIRGA